MNFKLETRTCACGKEFKPTMSRQIHCHRRCDNGNNVNSLTFSDRQRNYKYKLYYGISIQDYNRMFEEQNGCCKICKTHQSEMKKKLHVDHNHKTGEVRSLLCHNCNLALGRLKEDPITIAAMLEYVS